MAILNNTYLSSSLYNTLPHIGAVSSAPEDHAADLQSLQDLLARHNVPPGVHVRLIHKHYDTLDGEVMVFSHSSVPGGMVQTMRPVKLPIESTLRPVHYFVGEDERLQAYEYEYVDDNGDGDGNRAQLPDLTAFEPFLVEFCHKVALLGLQRKFGLKIVDPERSDGANSRTEYEFPLKRSTITIPEGLPVPDENDSESYSVITEWSPGKTSLDGCSHSMQVCTHCKHKKGHATLGDDHFTLGGRVLLPGSPVHDLVAAVVEAW